MKTKLPMMGLLLIFSLLVAGCGSGEPTSYDEMADLQKAVERAADVKCDDEEVEEKDDQKQHFSCKPNLRLTLHDTETSAKRSAEDTAAFMSEIAPGDASIVQGGNWMVFDNDHDRAATIHKKMGGDLYDGK